MKLGTLYSYNMISGTKEFQNHFLQSFIFSDNISFTVMEIRDLLLAIEERQEDESG